MARNVVLVVGAGIAGISAANVLADAGQEVLLVDQAPQAGGNFYRQSFPEARELPRPRRVRERWQGAMARLQAHGDKISLRCSVRFAGVDHTGVACLSDLKGNNDHLLRPAAVIVATGATECVRPRPGGTTPGVMTVGALQTLLKSSGESPNGPIVLAGTGPLLMAVGAQLAKAGNPPLCILDTARPYRRALSGLRLPASYLLEAVDYLGTLVRAGVPIYWGAEVAGIAPGDRHHRLKISIQTRGGKRRQIGADYLGLHDGLKPNDYGVTTEPELKVWRTGDCREVLGARAAALDGERIGSQVADYLGGGKFSDRWAPDIARHRQAQAVLHLLYPDMRPFDIAGADKTTVLCRCENRTVEDLRALGQTTAKQARLLGRFAMGPCQGRFCGETLAASLTANPDDGRSAVASPVLSSRWPIAPIRVQGIVDAELPDPSSANE